MAHRPGRGAHSSASRSGSTTSRWPLVAAMIACASNSWGRALTTSAGRTVLGVPRRRVVLSGKRGRRALIPGLVRGPERRAHEPRRHRARHRARRRLTARLAGPAAGSGRAGRSRPHQDKPVKVVAGHGTDIGRAAPGVDGAVRVQAADDLALSRKRITRTPRWEARRAVRGRARTGREARRGSGPPAGRQACLAARVPTGGRCAGRTSAGAATGRSRTQRRQRRQRRVAATRPTNLGRPLPDR